MNLRKFLLFLPIFGLISACKPSEVQQVATITALAGEIITSQTASVPTATLVPPTPVLQAGDTRISPLDGMTQVYIPAGEYTLGSNQEEVNWALEACEPCCNGVNYQDELWEHTAVLDSFWIDQTEVTVGMFRQFVEETGYLTTAERLGTSYVFLIPIGRQSELPAGRIPENIYRLPLMNFLWERTIQCLISAGMMLMLTVTGLAAACPRKRSGKRLPGVQTNGAFHGATRSRKKIS